MNKQRLYLFFCLALFTLSHTFDNRFFHDSPLYLTLSNNSKSSLAATPFLHFADQAYATVDKEISIFEMQGPLDLGVLGRAMQKQTGQNPLDSYFHDKNIPFIMNSNLKLEGINFSLYHQIIDQVGFGFTCSFMSQQSWYTFHVDTLNFLHTKPIIETLEKERRVLFNSLNIEQDNNHHTGLDDFDIFLRLGNIWDYALKCRRINAGIRLGMIVPTGVKRNINQPLLVPCGGNGFLGLYSAIDCLLELKEHFKCGLFFGLSKRLSKTVQERISLLGEPYLFGATTGNVKISPGLSLICTPYLLFEHLRSGLGAGIFYTLNYHAKDRWNIDATIPIDKDAKNLIEKNSNWASDYIGLRLMYDFNAHKTESILRPLIAFQWDIPTSFFVAKRVAKTHRISLSLEYDY